MCPCKCPVRIPRCGAVTVFKSKVGILGDNMIGQTQALALLIRLPPGFGSDHKLIHMVKHKKCSLSLYTKENRQ